MIAINRVTIFFLLTWSGVVLGQEHWPQFRGTHGSGVTMKQNLPQTWDVETGKHIAWKMPVPGRSYASPIIWGQKAFIVTAEKGKGDQPLNRWQVWAIQLQTGEVLWRKVAHSALPNPNRPNENISTHATPATDGKVVVAMFGSAGLHAFDMSGEKLWSKNFGKLNIGDFEKPNNEWNHVSSPIIYDDLVFLQFDTPKEDFIVALASQTGKEVWRTVRDELPSVGTPTWIPGHPNEIVTNGPNYIRGYDAATGKELWRLAGSSQVDTAPIPIFTKDLMVVASGKRQVQPIFAIKRGARGNITPGKGKTSSKALLWSKKGRGPYLPTPIIVGDLLYSLKDNGILDCYELATGAEVYRERVPAGVFTASPVAADGKLYFTSLDGEIFVVPVGRTFQIEATNQMAEGHYATPAIANGTMLVRGEVHLFAIRKN